MNGIATNQLLVQKLFPSAWRSETVGALRTPINGTASPSWSFVGDYRLGDSSRDNMQPKHTAALRTPGDTGSEEKHGPSISTNCCVLFKVASTPDVICKLTLYIVNSFIWVSMMDRVVCFG